MTYRLYGHPSSGNCLKPALLLERLELDWEWVKIDIFAGEAREETFRRKNPNGRVPVLESRPGEFLPESNAILCFLAAGTPWLPDDPWTRAQVLRWMFFEQNNHEPAIAASRALEIGYYDGRLEPAEQQRRLQQLREPGLSALTTMERHLKKCDWFVGARESVADLALYAYTHTAPEGGFDLDGFPAIRAWLERVAAHPRHLTLTDLEKR